MINLYDSTVGELPNKLVQQMLRMIKHDSQKHAMMLSILLDFLEGEEVFMEDRRGLADSLRRHLELEAESIKRGEKLLGQTWLRDRKGYRSIVESWVDDERKHHKFLRELSDKPFTPISADDFSSVFRDEVFFEERYRRSKAFWEKEKDPP